MRKSRTGHGLRRFGFAAGVAACLGGCAQFDAWLEDRRAMNAPRPVVTGPDISAAEVYLNKLYALAEGHPALQAEIYLDAESGAKLTPGPATNLLYALVLATPGHAEADPQQAQSRLRELLAEPELMTPAEISLATIHLKSVEELIVLNAEARRLRAMNSRIAQTEEQAVNRRIAGVEAENRQLREELKQAEDKLEALTSIERSIRERQP